MPPVLETLVERTAAVGARYFQLVEEGLSDRLRAGSPHGAPRSAAGAARCSGRGSGQTRCCFSRTPGRRRTELGVLALTAAPVHDPQGRLVGRATSLLTLLAAQKCERDAHEGRLRALGRTLEGDAEARGHTPG